MKAIVFAAALGLAGSAFAQDVPPGTPAQGSPPATNTPSPATTDMTNPAPASTDTSSTDTSSTSGGATAPVNRPQAATDTNPTPDVSTDAHGKHRRRPH